jgi:UTP--glucose-1-phosphate uridylyltransferase
MGGRIRKAVFPAGGLGTRFLPATKVVPKELLPVAGKPAIQHVVDEARAAGIEHCIFVLGRNKNAIEDLFDIASGLEIELADRGRASALLELDRSLPIPGATSFTRQQAPLGLGHAVWCARRLIGEEPFAVLLPDVVARSEPGCLAQLLDTYRETGGNVVGIEECSPDETGRFGVVGVGEAVSKAAFRITGMVEKPAPAVAPSTLRINGRYILQPEIFDILATQEKGAGGEIQLTDSIAVLGERQPVFGHRFNGRSFDCGSPAGFLAANIAFAMDDTRLAEVVRRELEFGSCDNVRSLAGRQPES